MASQESPVRINSTLVHQAKAASQAFHRSVPEQISYWAEIGRMVESRLSPEQISYLKSGLACLNVLPASQIQVSSVQQSPLDIVALARKAQGKKQTESARQAIKSRNEIRYQASQDHPGLLEQVLPSGEVFVGHFKNGKFKKMNSGTH